MDYPPITLTFLSPEWSEARVNKTFARPTTATGLLDPINNSPPILTSGYDLGTKFRHRTVGPIEDLEKLHQTFKKAASLPVFRIYGTPREGLPETASRNNENFLDTPTALVHLDVDGWKVPEGYSSLTREHWAEFLPALLEEAGLDPFVTASCLVLQSASSWRTDSIRAHLYYLLTSAVTLDALRGWALSLNKLKNQKVVDGAVYRQVQPDFIAKRYCVGFEDPLPEDTRLFILDGIEERVDGEEFKRYLKKVAVDAGFTTPESAATGTSGKPETGANWQETLSLCGSERGINEPAFRAAAQLVQSVGTNKVRRELAEYVERVYDEVWSAIRLHNPDPTAKGARGGTEDIRNYDRTKIRGYITTALEKSFGENVDKDIDRLWSAIDNVATEKQPPSFLFEPDNLAALARIRSKHKATWADMRDTLKNRLKGRVNLSELMKSIPSDTGEGRGNENFFIEEVLGSFDWIRDPVGGLYCKVRNASVGYSLVPVAKGAKDILFSRGLEVSGNTCSLHFAPKALSVLMSSALTPEKTRFQNKNVRRRVWPEQQIDKRATWINLGRQADGRQPLVKITEKPPFVQIKSAEDCPVLWRTEESVAPIPLPDPQKIRMKFGLVNGEGGELMHQRSMEYFVRELRRFVACDPEDYSELITWCVLSILDQSLSYLLQLVGAPQSGKSTAADFLQSLIDPQTVSVCDATERHPLYKDRQTLNDVLGMGYVTVFDNLSNLRPEEQDLLCQVLTGYKVSTRIYYSQKYEDKIIKKPVILTTIEDLVSRSDLRSRSMIASFSKSEFDEDEIEQKWDQEKPYMFFGLCHLAGEVLKEARRTLKGPATGLGRDFWVSVVRSTVIRYVYPDKTPVERTEMVLGEVRRRTIEAALLHSNTTLLIAWLSTDERFNGEVEEYSEYTSTFFQWFIEWCNLKAGLTVEVKGHVIGISPANAPKTSRGFGAFVSQGSREAKIITGWDISNHVRDSNGIRRIFTLTKPKILCNVISKEQETLYEDLL